MKQFLVVKHWIDDPEYDGAELMTLRQMTQFVSMDDCYPELNYQIYMISGMEVIPIHYTGWQPGLKMTFVDDNGRVVVDGYYGIDH